MFIPDIDELVQERRNSIANTLDLHLSCTNPSIYHCGTDMTTRTPRTHWGLNKMVDISETTFSQELNKIYCILTKKSYLNAYWTKPNFFIHIWVHLTVYKHTNQMHWGLVFGVKFCYVMALKVWETIFFNILLVEQRIESTYVFSYENFTNTNWWRC